MAVSFAGDPAATGFSAPTRFEADVFDCEIEGKVPADLDGAFYRLGWDWFYPSRYPLQDGGIFNGDGYVGMFRFCRGSVDYKGRYVRTPRYLADRQARAQRFGVYRNRLTDEPGVRGANRTVANTAVYVHANRLFALKEDSVPFELDPNTLETRGPWDFYGKYASQTFTAHPKRDQATGDMIAYGYQATGDASDDVYVYVIGPDGHVRREVRFKAPIVSMMHDIALTEKHLVFNTTGFVTSEERLQAGKAMWAWDSTVPTYVGILPRDGEGKDIRWFRGPERGAIHLMGAVTEGNKVTVIAPVSDGNPFPFFAQADGSPWNPLKAATGLRKWSFDLASNKDTWEEAPIFAQAPGALSRIDDRYYGAPFRYGFMGYADASRPFDQQRLTSLAGPITNCYGKFDLHTGKLNSYFVGPAGALQEVQFIPRRPGAPEGDGYLIGVASNFAQMHSELVIADTADLEAGDVARIKLPFRLNNQVHGWWVDRRELPALAEPR